jgi:hypothetical protein
MNYFRIVISFVVLLSVHLEADAECTAEGPVGYLCGVRRAEDMVAIPQTQWIVASGLSQGSEPGALFLIDRLQKTSTALFPSNSIQSEHDSRAYPGCPEPVSAQSFSAHGLNLRRGGKGVHALYVVNHGKREAVEAFELDVSRGVPALVWKGCVLLPDGTIGNAVSPLEDGGIAVTLTAVPQYFDDPRSASRPEAWTAKAVAAQLTGHVARWAPDHGWTMVPGTAASIPNGVETSADGRWLWVANWAEGKVVRVPLRGGLSPSVLKLDFLPDNLRWGDDGQLWVTGATGTPASYFECWSKPGCKNDYAIVKIDPTSLAVVRVPHPNTLREFGDATTALKVESEVWLGAYPSDRIGYMRLEN